MKDQLGDAVHNAALPTGAIEVDDKGTIIIEPDSPAWDQAWNALIATGRDPANGWMLMSASRAAVPGGLRYAFKNHQLPFMADDPAYNGYTKYLCLPACELDHCVGRETPTGDPLIDWQRERWRLEGNENRRRDVADYLRSR